MKYDEKPLANPFVILREEFDDWAILYNPDTGRGFGLSPTGVYVWKLLDGEHSIHEMLKVLHRDFQGVPQEAGTHIVAFVEELTLHGLVTYVAGPKHPRSHQSKAEPELIPQGTEPAPIAIAYDAPQLINLSVPYAAYGSNANCTTGATCCTNGTVTSGGNCQSGTTTRGIDYCKYGTTAPGGCSNTGSAASGGGTAGCANNGLSAAGGMCLTGGGH